MGMRWVASAAALALGFMAAGVHAQARYACRIGKTVYESSQPCPSTSATRPAYYGPTEQAPRYESPPPRATGEAPAHSKYMSPRCASLHDSIRTAPVRGLASDTVTSMRKEYSRECAENEREAQAMLSQEAGEKNRQKREEKVAEKRAGEQASVRAQQCGESKRILVTKKARTDLTDGEKADLRRFEDNYLARCT